MSPFRASPGMILRERRSSRRYSIALELRWKLFNRKRLRDSGVGTTVDISSGGILFESDHRPATPGFMELAITWPAGPNDIPPMQLLVIGRVVRVSGTRVAIRIRQHGFSTPVAGQSGSVATE
jgi:PilZ domain